MSDDVAPTGPPEPARAPRPATIRDVARAAAVSLGTASKALNGLGQLRPETRQRVREAATALDFRPNEWALSLHRRRTFTIGLISTDSFGRFSMPVLEGIESALGEARVSVFLCNAADDPARERRHVEALLDKRVDGLIVTARRTDPRPPLDLGRSGVPVVYAYAQPNAGGARCVLPDDGYGGALATRHLLGLGRHRLAHVTGPPRFLAVRERAEAFGRCAREAGAATDAVRYGTWSEEWGRAAAREILEVRSDAIFCGSDQIARGVADGLRELGVRVPDDVALVGYDNWEVIAAATRPPLTTVDMNLHELGRQAGALLLGIIAGLAASDPIRVPGRLVVRESCGAAAARALTSAGGPDQPREGGRA